MKRFPDYVAFSSTKLHAKGRIWNVIRLEVRRDRFFLKTQAEASHSIWPSKQPHSIAARGGIKSLPLPVRYLQLCFFLVFFSVTQSATARKAVGPAVRDAVPRPSRNQRPLGSPTGVPVTHWLSHCVPRPMLTWFTVTCPSLVVLRRPNATATEIFHFFFNCPGFVSVPFHRRGGNSRWWIGNFFPTFSSPKIFGSFLMRRETAVAVHTTGIHDRSFSPDGRGSFSRLLALQRSNEFTPSVDLVPSRKCRLTVFLSNLDQVTNEVSSGQALSVEHRKKTRRWSTIPPLPLNEQKRSENLRHCFVYIYVILSGCFWFITQWICHFSFRVFMCLRVMPSLRSKGFKSIKVIRSCI